MKKLDELEISNGTEVASLSLLSSLEKQKPAVIIEEISKSKLNFDITEIEDEEILTDLRFDISRIDSIEYTVKDDFFPDFLSIRTDQKTDLSHNEKTDLNITDPTGDSSNTKNIENEAVTNEIDSFDNPTDDNIASSVEIRNEHIENKNDDFSISIGTTDKIKLYDIDANLKNDNIYDEESLSEDSASFKDEEVFGIKKSEVFQSIDKKITSTRADSSITIENIKGLKNGFFLPFIVVLSSVIFLFIAIPLLSLYFSKTSKTSLEENYISDSSILEKIAKKKEEEAKLAKQKLEEERKNFEFEKNKISSRINEEYTRVVEEIQKEYKAKLDEIIKSGLSKKEIEDMKIKLEEDRQIALGKAKRERDRKLSEQEKFDSEKDKNLKESEEKLKRAIENKEFEVSKITSDLQQKLKEKDMEKENVALKLKELSENNKKIKEFNQMVYQLINSAIVDFKNGNKDQSIIKLNNITKYYETRLDFVNINEDLKSKMETDLLFVETVAKMIDDSKKNTSFNEEYVKLLDKFKKISGYYKEAENYYTQKNYQKSNELYGKILSEFEEINYSYKKIQDTDIKIQNTQAVINYNLALNSMKEEKYEIALKNLTTVIKETPMSDYANMALSDIVKLSDTLSIGTKVRESDAKAKSLFESAMALSKNRQYKEAIEKFTQTIIDYPHSSYTKEALKNTMDLNIILTQEEAKKVDIALRDKFKSDYNKFIESYKKSDYKSARENYIQALKNTFNLYTGNSMGEFVDAEDKYIAGLLEHDKIISEANLKKQLEDLRFKLQTEFDSQLKIKEDTISEYKNEMVKLKNEHENEIKKIEDNYRKLLADSSLSSSKNRDDEIAKLKTFYESEIDKKNADFESKQRELENRNKDLTEKTKDLEEKNSELLTKAQDSSEIDSLKKDLEKKESELNKTQAESNKIKEELASLTKKYGEIEERLKKDEGKNVETLNKQLAELQTKYNELQKKLDENRDNLDSKKADYEEEYKREIEKEKARLRDEFTKQLEILKKEKIVNNEIENSKKDTEKINLQNKFIARIIEIVDGSITFQFLASDFTSKIAKGEKLKVVRFNSKNNQEINVGIIEINFTDKNSLFARGKIITVEPNQSVQVNDLLKY